MKPVVSIYPKYREDWKNLFCGHVRGECLDFPHDSLMWTDMDQRPSIGDLVGVRNTARGGNSLSIKYLFEYNGRLILVSRHPPVAMWSGLEIVGPVVMRMHYEGEGREPTEGALKQIMHDWQESAARGYGSPQWFMQQLGAWPPASCRTTPNDKAGVRPFNHTDRQYAINRWRPEGIAA